MVEVCGEDCEQARVSVGREEGVWGNAGKMRLRQVHAARSLPRGAREQTGPNSSHLKPCKRRAAAVVNHKNQILLPTIIHCRCALSEKWYEPVEQDLSVNGEINTGMELTR
jgi:hypothetical protein